MVDPFLKMKKRRIAILTRILISAVVIAGITAMGVAVFTFMNYKQAGGMLPEETSFAQVAISSPPHGVQVEAGDSLMVEVAAIGSIPFQSMELWINGELLGVQTAPNGGVHPFSTSFSWSPPETGMYSLISSAIDINGQKAVSSQVVVFVIPDATGIEYPASDSPSVLPVPSDGGYTAPAGPSPDDNSGPADIWSVSVGDWVTNLTADESPAAPELAASAGECAAVLQIHDLSDNEEGFAVYRQTGISPMWIQIATLSSQAEFDWITYEDEGIYGAVSYYVTAFNSQGESASNIVLVSIDPADCTSVGKRSSVSTVGVTLHIPNLSAEKVYCYLSTDEMSWARWPQSGFLTPSGEGIQTEILAMNLTGDESGEEQAIPEMSLFMECWGWEGGNLQYLGKLESKGIHPQAERRLNILGEGMSADLVLEKTVLPNQADFYPIGTEINKVSEVLLNLGSIDGASPQIPRANLSVTLDKEICGKHLPPDAQNFIGQMLYCFPYPEYDLDKGAIIPQPYLVWGFDFEPICAGGVGEQCKSYWELLSMAEETGGQVGFTIVSLLGGIKNVWNVTEPNLTMFVVPPLTCLGDTQFSVRLWYRPGSQGVEVSASPEENISEIGEVVFSPPEILYGPYSNWITIPCNSSNLFNPTLFEYYREVEVSFNDLYFSHLDDGGGNDYVISSDTSVELYGYFRVKAPSMGHWEKEYCFHPWAGDCNEEPYWTGTFRYLLAADWEEDDSLKLKHVAPENFTSSFEDLEYWDLCQATTKYSCSYEGQATSSDIQNNSLRVIVKEGDTLKIQVRLIDYDELSDDDEVCVGTVKIPSEDFIYGDFGDKHGFSVSGKLTDSGKCDLNGSIMPSSIWKKSIP